MTYEIVPYKNAGPIVFGMNEKELKNILGEPLSVTESYIGTKVFIYDGITIGFAKETDHVNHIGFGEEIDVKISGVNVFGDPDAFANLLTLDGDPYEDVGIIVFLNLGITMTGFHTEEEKSIVAFVKGENADIKQHGKPFKFVNNYE